MSMQTEAERAATILARAVRWHPPGSPEVLAARRELVRAKLAAKQAELDVLRRELDQIAIMTDYPEAAS
jgi:hypothetical protein